MSGITSGTEGTCFRDRDGGLHLLTFIREHDSAAIAKCEGLAVAVVPRNLREGGKAVKTVVAEVMED
jgi:hypothetical protein